MPAVREAMASDWAAMERGERTLAEAAETSLGLARAAATDAERFLFYKGAVDLFTRAGRFDRASEALAAMRREFEDISDAVADEISERAGGGKGAAQRIVGKSLSMRGAWDFPTNLVPPLLRSLWLEEGTEIRFAAIPAGTFRMSNAGGKGSHEVTITRPFWISTSFVTARQFDASVPVQYKRHDPAMAECERLFPDMDVAAFRMTAQDCNRACVELNARFAGCIPPGYEFRFPTEAELEYALRRGGGEAKLTRVEPLTRRLCAERGVENMGGVRLLPRGETNGWGVVSFFTEAMHVLDRIDIDEGHRAQMDGHFLIDDDAVNEVAAYRDSEVDPLRLGEYCLVRHLSDRRILAANHFGLARIVIAPVMR